MDKSGYSARQDIMRIEVKRKKAGVFGWFSKIMVITLGIFGVLLGAIISLTIIGILIGFPMMIGGFGFIALGMGRQVVKCPNCDKRNTVLQRAEDFKCARCSIPVVIYWKK